MFRNLEGVNSFFPSQLFANKDAFDAVLFKLFVGIIKAGRRCFAQDKKYDSSLNESNYLQKDINYYNILKIEWDNFFELITSTFEEIKNCK